MPMECIENHIWYVKITYQTTAVLIFIQFVFKYDKSLHITIEQDVLYTDAHNF